MTRILSYPALLSLLALVASACAQPNRCGANGEYCCVNEAGGGYCLGTDVIGGVALRCDAATVTCVPDGVGPVCGAQGQACCAGSTCTGVDGTGSPLVCMGTTCQPAPSTCGALGQTCCGGTSCTGTLVCNAGSCQMPPAGTACPGPTGECDIGLQDCGASQACALSIENTTSCRAAGSGVDQSPCSSDTSCAIGHYCSPFSGRCHPQCCGDVDCGTQQVCIATGTTGNAGLCFGSPCDAVSGSGCASGSACYVGGNPAGGVLTLCVPPGTGAAGSACEALDDCVPGYVCLGSPGTCAELCRVSAPSCSIGTCAALEGATDLGVCQ